MGSHVKTRLCRSRLSPDQLKHRLIEAVTDVCPGRQKPSRRHCNRLVN